MADDLLLRACRWLLTPDDYAGDAESWQKAKRLAVGGAPELARAYVAAMVENERLTADNARYRHSLKGVVDNAIRNGETMEMYGRPAWAVVMDLTANGSTAAHALCREFGVNPDEKVPAESDDEEDDESEDDDG